jgi:hypothetical protein
MTSQSRSTNRLCINTALTLKTMSEVHARRRRRTERGEWEVQREMHKYFILVRVLREKKNHACIVVKLRARYNIYRATVQVHYGDVGPVAQRCNDIIPVYLLTDRRVATGTPWNSAVRERRTAASAPASVERSVRSVASYLPSRIDAAVQGREDLNSDTAWTSHKCRDSRRPRLYSEVIRPSGFSVCTPWSAPRPLRGWDPY